MRFATNRIPDMLRRWNRVPGPWLVLVALVVPFGWLAPVFRLAWARVHRPPAPPVNLTKHIDTLGGRGRELG